MLFELESVKVATRVATGPIAPLGACPKMQFMHEIIPFGSSYAESHLNLG